MIEIQVRPLGGVRSMSLSLLIQDKQRSLSIYFLGVTAELKAFLRNVSKSTLRKGTKIEVKLTAHLLKVHELCRRMKGQNEMQISSSVSYRIGLIRFLWGKDEMVRDFWIRFCVLGITSSIRCLGDSYFIQRETMMVLSRQIIRIYILLVEGTPEGEKGRRIRELTSFVKKKFKFHKNNVGLYAKRVTDIAKVVVRGVRESRVEPIKEEEEKASEVAATIETKVSFFFSFLACLAAVMNQHKIHKEGDALMRSVASRMNKMTGKEMAVSLRLECRLEVPKGINTKGINTTANSFSDFPPLTKVTGPRPFGDKDASNLHNIDDVAKLFGMPLNTVKDINNFVQDLQWGKHELWPLLSKEKGNEITDIVCNRYVVLSESTSIPKSALIVDDLSTKVSPNVDDNLSSKDSPSDLIVQLVDVNTKSTYYAGAVGSSTMAQPQVSSFRPLVIDLVFNGVNISIPYKTVEKSGPWMIRNTLIILKKWSMSTSLLKEELTGIPIWICFAAAGIFNGFGNGLIQAKAYRGPDRSLSGSVLVARVGRDYKKAEKTLSVTDRQQSQSQSQGVFGFVWTHDKTAKRKDYYQEGRHIYSEVRILEALSKAMTVFEEDGISLIATYLGTPIMLDSYTTSMCKESWGRNSFARCLIEINLEVDFMDSITIGIPDLDGPGVPMSKGFQVGKEFEFQHMASNVGSNGDTGTRGDTNSKQDMGKKKISNIASPSPFAALGANDDEDEETNLVGHAVLMRSRPGVLLGDFNAALNLEDHSVGGYEPNAAMREFKECVQAMAADVNCTGLHFTWNQKPKGSNGILKKIDRIMANIQFIDDFPGSFAIFQPYRISNHSPCVLRIPTGCAMFRVVKRLKGLKSPFHKLLHNHGNLHEWVNKIRIELDEAQKTIDRDPSCSILCEEHAHFLLAFKATQLDEERFLKQKANIEWLKVGDSNTAYFHKIVKCKCAKNRIDMVSDASNNLYDGNKVLGAFVNHYNQFLGAEGVTIPLDDHDLFARVLDDAKADFMVREVSNDEVKSVIFSMGEDRAPGPDGFTAAFFKKAWDVVCGDITCAVWDFFLQWVCDLDDFQYHHICEQQRIINLCFADDLFLFSRGNPCLVAVIMDALEEFKHVSSLVPSIPKSTMFFCNIPNAIKASILNSMPFAEGLLLSGFSLDDSVNNLISDGVWRWPLDCLSRLPTLAQLQVPLLLDDIDDVILWRDRDGVLRPFSVACAWDTIRASAENVDWYNVVWFPHCIPRHAIHMWLIFQQKLKTQDRLRQWDVWSKVRVLCGMDSIPPRLIDVTTFINLISKGKTAVSILCRLVLAATLYYIWMQRNGRVFKKKTPSPDQIVDVIISMVRLKLVTFKFKKMSTRSRLLLDQWKIPSYCIIHNGSFG
nr:hypothetical protein [Tanacetum cinerariifolium]